MAQTDMLKRYLDAGIAFTQMTQRRAESIVKDLVKAGEVQSEQRQARVQELMDRSRENTERLLEQVRAEVRSQISSLGLATDGDVQELRRSVDELRSQVASVASSAGASSAPAGAARAFPAPAPTKKATAKKSAAKKASPAKTTAKKATAKKSAAKKASGNRS